MSVIDGFAKEVQGEVGAVLLDGASERETPLRYEIGQRVRVTGLCDIRSLIGQTGEVVENFNFTVRIKLDNGAYRILRHESISAIERPSWARDVADRN